MKKIFIFFAVTSLFLPSKAQDDAFWGKVPIIYDSYGHKISRDGSFSTGEAVSIESSWGRDNLTGEIYLYDGASCGDGNSISKDHRIIGTDKLFMKAAFLVPNKDPELISSLSKYSESFAHAITWEGTRICGVVSNPRSSGADENDPEKQTMSYLPFYCDIDLATGNALEPVILPTPPRDFFGVVPQYCTAEWISDDGKTILGQVIDNTGYFVYPIIYKEDENGKWEYSLPSEKLFNPDNLEVPVWPKPEMSAPQAENFISNQEFKELFKDMLEAYQNNPSNPDPFDLLNPDIAGSDALMTKDDWNAYVDALIEYDNYYKKYQKQLDEYYDKFSRFIANSTHFLQSGMAMNNDGTLISQTKIVTKFFGNQPVEYLIPTIFNLTDGSYKFLGDDFSELIITQILPDGTVIAVTPKPGPATPDLSPQRSFVLAPSGNEFIPLEDYIKDSNPEVYQWMKEYLYHEIEVGYDEEMDIIEIPMTVTGLVAVSDDFTSLSGGVDAWAWVTYEDGYVTYFLSGLNSPNAGIEQIQHDIHSYGLLNVFNTSGVKVLTTKDPADLQRLPKGIYIVNDKKLVIK